MDILGTTSRGYTVHVLPPGSVSPMRHHRGGEIAVDDAKKCMYAWGIYVVVYGTDSILRACERYHAPGETS